MQVNSSWVNALKRRDCSLLLLKLIQEAFNLRPYQCQFVSTFSTLFISCWLSCFDWAFSRSMYVNFGVEADFLITIENRGKTSNVMIILVRNWFFILESAFLASCSFNHYILHKTTEENQTRSNLFYQRCLQLLHQILRSSMLYLRRCAVGSSWWNGGVYRGSCPS